MQFNRRLIVRFGSAIVAAIVIALVRWVGGFGPGGESRSTSHQDAPPPVASETRPAEHSDRNSSSDVPRSSPRAPVSTGDFDYYVLVLSWSPTHCSSQSGHGHDDDMQCRS